MAENKKFERLFIIYTSLILDGFIPKSKFISENNMSIRTAQRDIEDIQRYLNINLISDKDKYSIEPDDLKRLRKGFDLSDNLKENADILFSIFMKKISSNLSLIPHSTISKLLPKNVDNDYYDVIIISNNEINTIYGNPDNINILLSYIKDLEDITFDYYIRSSNINYTVNAVAYLIYYFQGIWYLVANDKKYNKIKTYDISNILDIKLCSNKLKFYNEKEKDDYINEHNNRLKKREELIKLIENKRSIYWSDNELIETIIYFRSEVAHYFKNRDYGFSQKVKKENEDGSIEVRFYFSSFTELRIFLSPWLGSCKIISPINFKKEFLQHINDALNFMSENSD